MKPEKLLNSSGRELRRALFSLKQIFQVTTSPPATRKKANYSNLVQDDKDLVHEFVRNDGLACLVKVGSEADQNYQNYILRGKFRISSPPNGNLTVLFSLFSAWPGDVVCGRNEWCH